MEENKHPVRKNTEISGNPWGYLTRKVEKCRMINSKKKTDFYFCWDRNLPRIQ